MSVKERKSERFNLTTYLPIYDMVFRKELGRVYDLSLGGCMIMGPEKIFRGRTIYLRCDYPHDMGSGEAFSVKAKCVWSKRDINPKNFISGFQFIYVADYIQMQIKKALECLS